LLLFGDVDIGPCQFVPRLLGGALPFDPRAGGIALSLSRVGLGDEYLALADAAIQTLAAQYAKSRFPP
jgi:hypothetical protein